MRGLSNVALQLTSASFFSNERQEPAHIHVEQAERYAKFWLTPVTLASNVGFRSTEVTQFVELVRAHRALFQERWNEYFGH